MKSLANVGLLFIGNQYNTFSEREVIYNRARVSPDGKVTTEKGFWTQSEIDSSKSDTKLINNFVEYKDGCSTILDE